jgi:hypothetical protein
MREASIPHAHPSPPEARYSMLTCSAKVRRSEEERRNPIMSTLNNKAGIYFIDTSSSNEQASFLAIFIKRTLHQLAREDKIFSIPGVYKTNPIFRARMAAVSASIKHKSGISDT